MEVGIFMTILIAMLIILFHKASIQSVHFHLTSECKLVSIDDKVNYSDEKRYDDNSDSDARDHPLGRGIGSSMGRICSFPIINAFCEIWNSRQFSF